MGEPSRGNSTIVKRIHNLTKVTWGTETSKYPEEKKENRFRK